MKKIFVLFWASLIGMLLCSGVALAGNCCAPVGWNEPYCVCMEYPDQSACENAGGTWMGPDGCDDVTGVPCIYHLTYGGLCCIHEGDLGNCCYPGSEGDPCSCDQATDETDCELHGGMWMGKHGCGVVLNKPCSHYCTKGGECVPEASTLVLFAVGLLSLAGYIGLNRRKTK